MWLTLDGSRTLRINERELFTKAVIKLIQRTLPNCDTISEDLSEYVPASFTQVDPTPCDEPTGITWFDQWDADQRIWLLDQICDALLVDSTQPPHRSAMLEAAIEAVFAVIHAEVNVNDNVFHNQRTTFTGWQQLLLNALQDQSSDTTESFPLEKLESFIVDEAISFTSINAHLQAMIVGPSCYEQAEQFRDGSQSRLEKFLLSKGLPPDYLTQIPPLPSQESTLNSMIHLRSLLS